MAIDVRLLAEFNLAVQLILALMLLIGSGSIGILASIAQ
jgi:hypothetical protein